MLTRPDPIKYETTVYPLAPDRSELADVLGFAIRNRYVIVLFAILCLLLGVVYLTFAPVRYTAATQVLLAPTTLNVDQQASMQDAQLDTSMIESQIAVMESRTIIEAVVRRLGLVADEEFSGTGADLQRSVYTYIYGEEPPSPTPQQMLETTIERVQDSLSVKRVGISYIIDVEFSSGDPVKSARIANAIADTYLANQAAIARQAIQRANAWLEHRLKIIRTEMLAAERAVDEYRAQNANSPANLLDLESKAQLQRKLYEGYYQRYLETSQQLSYPILQARVIAPAVPPMDKSEPRTLFVLGLAGLLGLALGGLAGLLADQRRRYD